MVLASWHIIGLPVALLATACLTHTDEAVRATTPMAVSVATVMSFPDRREVVAIPQEVADDIGRVLLDHNLQPTFLDAASYTEEFGTRRAVPHRLAWMAENASSAELLLLVEAEPRFYSQLSGRYRWTVPVTITLAPRNNLDQSVSSSADIPVFLEFYHERENETMKAAAPLIERSEGYLLDEYLGGLTPTGH